MGTLLAIRWNSTTMETGLDNRVCHPKEKAAKIQISSHNATELGLKSSLTMGCLGVESI